MPDLKALTLSATSFSTTGAIGDVLATIGETSPALALPVAQNRGFAVLGDSRSESMGTARPGVAGSVNPEYLIGSYPSWLSAMCPQIYFPVDANFGIGGQNSTQLNTIPRPGNAAKGIDVLNSKTHMDNVLLLIGTNEDVSTQLVRDNVRAILDKMPDKVIFLQNEWPRGRNEAGAVQNALSNPGAMKAYSEFLTTFGHSSGNANARANVVSLDSYGALVNPASGTAYDNLVGTLGDGLHENEIGAYLLARQFAPVIDQLHDRSVSYLRLPTAADPMAPTTQELAGWGNSNPFMLGTNGNVFGFTNAPTGAGVPSNFWLRSGGGASGNGSINTVTSFYTDADGYRVFRVRFTGTAGTASTNLWVYQNVSGSVLSSKGIVPGDTIQAQGKVMLTGAIGQLKVDTGNPGQSGYWLNLRSNLGLRKGVGGVERLPADALTTMYPFRTFEAPTQAGATWGEGNSGWLFGVFVEISTAAYPAGTAIDITLDVSRMGVRKVA